MMSSLLSGSRKIEIPLMITQWTLCFWWGGGLQCFCSDKQINTLNALCCECAHMGIWCWAKCERKRNLRSSALKVAFKRITNYQTWTVHTYNSLCTSLPPSGRYIYSIGSFSFSYSVSYRYVFVELLSLLFFLKKITN